MQQREIQTSLIIVTWNSADLLKTCLDKLRLQTNKNFEIILVDNGSDDIEVIVSILSQYKDLNITLEKNKENFGFAVANNKGVQFAKGEWIALLNADAFPEPDWLEQLLKAAKQNPEYNFFTSRQIQAHFPSLLDGAGDAYHTSGLAWRKYYNYPVSQYGLEIQEVFSACAAAALYRKADFLQVGGFDETYFSYFEDVDLSFRLRLQGGRCLYVPQAVVHHIGSSSTGKASDFAFYHGHRNLVWTFFKDMPNFLLVCYLPFHIMMNIYLSLIFLVREGRGAVIKSKIDAFLALSSVLKSRKRVQKMRTVSNLDIYKVLTKGLLAPHYVSRSRTNEPNIHDEK